MYQKISNLISRMEKLHWLRMTLLFLPGLLLYAMADALDFPRAVRLACAAVLGLGTVLYIFWKRIYQVFFPGEAAADDANDEQLASQPVDVGHEIEVTAELSAKMRYLCKLCDGNLNEAFDLVKEEYEVNEGDIARAIHTAMARRMRQN